MTGVLERIAAIAESNGYNLRAPLQFQQKLNTEPDHSYGDGVHNNSVKPVPPRPVQPPKPQPAPERPAQAPQKPTMPVQQRPPEVKQSGLFSSLKGGAGSFLKNLKDTSSKVMATMQQ